MPDETTNPGWKPQRRTFLKTAGLIAAGSLTACHNNENILPLLDPDARAIPGRAAYFATTCRECPAGCGMVATVHDGRATKAEGNPDHPVNRGKLCMRGQSALEGIYNPDRFRQLMLRDVHGKLQPISWSEALGHWREQLQAAVGDGHVSDVAWLGQLETGTLAGVIADWTRVHGFAAPLVYEPFSYDALRAVAGVVPSFHLDRARYLLSFGAEFLETWISNVEFTQAYTAMHSFRSNPDGARFVAVGPRLNLTAANADEYWPARPGTEHLLAWALVTELAARGVAVPAGARLPAITLAEAADASGIAQDVIERAAARLDDIRPSLVLGPGYGGDTRAAESCQQAVGVLNRMLGNEGITVDAARPHALSAVAPRAEVAALFARAQSGNVRVLHLHHANPIFHHPKFESALARVPFVVSFASWADETTAFAHLILPDNHFLESWGDYAPYPDVTGILQPARLRVYDTRATGDLLLTPDAAPEPTEGAFAAHLAATWQARLGGGETAWEELLQRGVYEAPLPARTAAPPPPLAAIAAPLAAAGFDGEGEFYLTLFPSVQFFDGRQANRAWCQEIAEPLSKIAWDGWAELHPTTAARLGLESGEVIRLESPYAAIVLPLFITTWIRPDCVGVLMGQGHSDFGMFASDCGDNGQRLLPPLEGAGWAAQSVKVAIRSTGRRRSFANLQVERLQTDKRIALAVERRLAASPAAHEPTEPKMSFYDHHPHPVHRWGMAIDLDRCIGCNACQAACYAENNVPVMGRSSCMSHREMTWIRVEIWEGDSQHPSTALNPDIRFMPIPCQQCGNAPCEYVCPVFAAYHTDEGLNGQVYNRCVGTRYCSNNCIYKVRRFNWYTPQWPQPLEQQLNPLVTVRSKGVMEKCTFCVQRIVAAERDQLTTGGAIRPIQTACMQTCPADAITFGDLNDHDSAVSQLSREPRAYGLFEDENTVPAVPYLKRTRFELNHT